jgi:Dockerin type I domain
MYWKDNVREQSGQIPITFFFNFSPEIVYLMFKSNSPRVFGIRLWSCLVVLIGTFCFQNTTFAQNCTLACNNLVQISLDDDCNVPVVPAMILQPGSCSGAQLQVIVYQIGSTTPIATSPNVTAANIGQTLVVKVLDPNTGNSCWSNALIEDKLPPQITTTPIHLYCNWPNFEPDYLEAFDVAGAIPTVIENCGSYTLTHSDESGDVDCNGTINNMYNISAYIKRTWVATDASGNHFNKIQWIYMDRKHVSDIDWPSDVTVECTTADIDPSSTGIPTIDFVTLWPESGFCELNVNYSDQFFQICDGSYKILRTWTGFDWCLPASGGTNPVNYIQVIKVLDTKGPTFICPNNQTTSTTSSTCLANYDLPDVLVTDGCSSIKTAKATYAGPNGSPITVNGALVLNAQNKLVAQFGIAADLPKGNINVTYAITDDCGNTTTCTFIVTVVDAVAPVAICRQITQIGLGTDGMANVPSSSFDEGSYDNCNQVWYKTRRMDANPCQNNDFFHEKVKFCCTDLKDTVMVILRVYDVNPGIGDVALTAFEGHYNDCMVEVYVVDKIKPTCIAPANVTTTCEAFDPSLWSYGVSGSTDNCCLDTITNSVNYANFDTTCLKGTISRTFTAKDCAGNTSKCTQLITVNYVDDYQVKFPDDVELNACNGTMNFGTPQIFNENCELIAISHTDKVFTLVPDACFKIIRTWEVINWCTYDSNNSLYAVSNPTNTSVGPTVSNDGFNGFTYTQIIKIHDSSKPTILNCPTAAVEFCDFTNNNPALFNSASNWDPIHLTNDLCEGPVDLKVEATDDCSAANLDIRYTIFADLNGDGSQETVINSQNNSLGFSVLYSDAGAKRTAQATRNSATSFELPYGLHKIKWYVSDGCGNESVCEYAFVIKDCKKPTVVCLNGLAVNIMNTATPMIELWASDFVNYGQDNCTPSAQLVYFIRKTGTGTGIPTTSNITFTCTEVGTQTVEIWAKDKAGNADYCETYILVQDNLGNCGSTSGSVAGFILTEDVQGVEAAEVNLKGSNPALPNPGLFNMTSVTGAFNFTALPIDPNYILSAKKDVNPTNGVNTFDLVRMSKHVLNVTPFTAPCDFIAADINKNGKVTTADIVELRKLILGIYSDFPANNSWRFVDKKYQFTSANPAGEAFPEEVLVSNANDFTAIKIGDVTGDALPNNLVQADDRNAVGNLVFSIKNRELTAGEAFLVDFTAEEMVAGYQFTLGFEGLEMLEIIPGAGMDMSNFNTLSAAENMVSTSFNGTEKGQFSVKFRATTSGKLSQMLNVSSRLTAAEAYNLANENLDVAFRFEGENGQNVVAGLGFELYQNQPNPVKESTNIRFYLPNASTATLTVSDAAGRIIKLVKSDFAKGYNAISLQRSELPASGVLFYQVETSAGSATKRMIAID